jgi:hypothetical protein
MTHTHRLWLSQAVSVLLAGCLSACHTPSELERNFGQSVRQAQSAQTPPQRTNTSLTPGQETGTDAGIVRSSIVRYEKTYVTPPSPVTSLDQSLGTAAIGTAR